MSQAVTHDLLVALDRASRSFEALSDELRLATDSLVRARGIEWEVPHLLLDDDDRAEIDARQLRRTLADIDALPES